MQRSLAQRRRRWSIGVGGPAGPVADPARADGAAATEWAGVESESDRAGPQPKMRRCRGPKKKVTLGSHSMDPLDFTHRFTTTR